MKDFKDLAAHSKVWIYQSNKPLNKHEVHEISNATAGFINSWQSHGADMDASFKIYFDRFLIVALDETSAGASGCGIDKLFHHIKKLEQNLNLNFFDRLFIYYTQQQIGDINNPKETPEIFQTHFSKLEGSDFQKISYVFDNTIVKKGDLNEHWLIPAQESWLAPHVNA